MSADTVNIIELCSDLKCVSSLVSGGKVNSLNYANKMQLISSAKSTPDLCIFETRKSHKGNLIDLCIKVSGYVDARIPINYIVGVAYFFPTRKTFGIQLVMTI